MGCSHILITSYSVQSSPRKVTPQYYGPNSCTIFHSSPCSDWTPWLRSLTVKDWLQRTLVISLSGLNDPLKALSSEFDRLVTSDVVIEILQGPGGLRTFYPTKTEFMRRLRVPWSRSRTKRGWKDDAGDFQNLCKLGERSVIIICHFMPLIWLPFRVFQAIAIAVLPLAKIFNVSNVARAVVFTNFALSQQR